MTMARDNEMQIGESRNKGQTSGQTPGQSEADHLRGEREKMEVERKALEATMDRFKSMMSGKADASVDVTQQQLDRDQMVEARRQAKEAELVRKHEAEDRSIEPNSLWWVTLTPTDGKSISPYLDVPRIFHCEKHEAMDRFMEHYGIRSTEHRFDIHPATKQQWQCQRERDKAARTSNQHFSREQIMAEAGLSPVAA
jgi:hypothetical protein